ncbi:MAG: hypothetical protein WC615_00160 [Mucilaginibacter sp.]|uniref:hypothetical protein n=1 Tax=Mucilaginibacter sp. TaxID=1882438 RepID=UPI003569E589
MKKQILGLIAIIIAVSASAFTTVKTPFHKTAALYWYQVTYDTAHPTGAVLSSSDLYTQDEKANVASPCDPGTSKDCLRGFSSQISTFPSTAMGADNIKRPN